jgi:hypothetical protein
MKAKDIVLQFYETNFLLHKEEVVKLLHPEVVIEWNSSKGFIQLDYNDIINLSQELNRSYIQSNMVISHIIEEKNKVAVRYAHFAKTIENPKEEMLLGHFFVIWEIKEDKLYKGFQISQFS